MLVVADDLRMQMCNSTSCCNPSFHLFYLLISYLLNFSIRVRKLAALWFLLWWALIKSTVFLFLLNTTEIHIVSLKKQNI